MKKVRSTFRRAATCALVALTTACTSATPVDLASPMPEFTLEDARWEGTWEFTYTLNDLEGVGDDESRFQLGSTIRRVWEVTPRCDRGPCDIDILATDPDDPLAPAVPSSAVYDSGVYRVTQSFAPVPEDACRTEDGDVFPSAFDATNSVEVNPTEMEVVDDRPLVTSATSTKRITFSPIASLQGRGGTCVNKTALWEGPVVAVLD